MGKDMEMMNQALSEHKPYAIIITDGTINNPKDETAEMFHAEVQVYRYNEESNQYETANHFERMIKVSAEKAEKIDFAKVGIDKEEYQKQAISPSAFSLNFFDFLNEELNISDKNTTIPLFIGSGNEDVCMNFLNKTAGSAETFKENRIEILSTTNILTDFLIENGIEGGKSNIALHKFLNPDGSKPDNTSKGKIALYQKMIEQHCENHGYLAEQTAEQENVQPEFVSPELLEDLPEPEFFNPSVENTEPNFDEMFTDVKQATFGEAQEEPPTVQQTPPVVKPPENIPYAFPPEMEKKITEYEERFRQEEEARRKAWSASGKKSYEDSGAKEKLETLGKMNKLDEETVLNPASDCAYNLFCQIANEAYYEETEGKTEGETLNANKGFTIIHVGTTGFKATGIKETDSDEQKENKKGGSPMQVYIATYMLTPEGTLEQTQIHASLVKADEQALQEAIVQADKFAETGSKIYFDTFKHGGTNREEYLALCQTGKDDPDKDFYTQESTAKIISQYMDIFPPQEFPIVTAFKNGLKSLLTLSPQMDKFAPAFEKAIDFTQVIKEYALVSLRVPEYHGENHLFPDGKTPEKFKNFSLSTLSEKWGKNITGSELTGEFVGFLAQNIHKHENEASCERIAELKQKQEEQNHKFETELPVQQEEKPEKPAEKKYTEDTIEPVQSLQPEEPSFFEEPDDVTEPVQKPDEPKEVPKETPAVPEQKELIPEEQTAPNPQITNPAPETPSVQNPADFLQQASSLTEQYQAQAQQLQAQQANLQNMQNMFAQQTAPANPEIMQMLTMMSAGITNMQNAITILANATIEMQKEQRVFMQTQLQLQQQNINNQMTANNLLTKTVENGLQQIQQGDKAIGIQTQQLQQSTEINQNQQAANQKTEQVLAEVKENSSDTHNLAVGLTQLLNDTLELHQSDNEIRKDMSNLTGALEHTTQSVTDMTQKIVSVDMEGKETKAALEETAQMAKETKAEVAEHASSIADLKEFRKSAETKLERHENLISGLRSSVNELSEKRKATDRAITQVATALGEEESRISETRVTLKNVLDETTATRAAIDKVTDVVIQHEDRLNLHEDMLMGEHSQEIEHTSKKTDRAG